MIKKQHILTAGLALALIVVAVASRLLPHPANFTPIAAIALFGGVYLGQRLAILVPLIALVISDFVLGFYDEIVWVYASFVLVGLIGMWISKRKTVPMIAGGTIVSSTVFYLITNFGVWAMPHSMYPKTWFGLLECYGAAIPFFRTSLMGDMIFVVVLFGIYEAVSALVSKPASQSAVN
jgi:hypothetical protein